MSTETVNKDIFKDVRFFLAEENNEEVKKVLKSGGATREFYISDLVTHVIATDSGFPQFSEAKDYNLTIVQPKWVFTSARCEMLLPCGAFQPVSDQLFKGVVVCPSQIPVEDRDALWAMVTFYGGKCQLNLNSHCTHLVIPQLTGAKYDCAMKHADKIKIVTPSWIIDCVKGKTKLDEANYRPQKEENKTQTETASSLLTPDEESNKATPVALPTTDGPGTSPADFTPVTTSSTVNITLPSTLMSPVSPVVTTATESKSSMITTANESKTPLDLLNRVGVMGDAVFVTDAKGATQDDEIPAEKEQAEEKEVQKSNVADERVAGGNIIFFENNNEKLVQDEKEGTSGEHGKEKTETEQGSTCLDGCVFVISDYPDVMDHTVLDTWIEVIEQHGGAVSPFYSKRCTHLLCLHQHGSLYQKAISEGKRIVTAHWLNDVLTAKMISPPSNPLHLPVPFEDKIPQCRNMVITVTGFTGAERALLKNMIFIIGAKYTGYLTRNNTHIICKSPSGEKYTKAREWGIYCVNAKWLGDIVTTGYPSPCNLVRYSTLGDPSELEITKDLLVRELILPWQTFDEEASIAQIPNNGKRKLGEQSTPENGQLRKTRRITNPDGTEKSEPAPRVLFTGVPPSEVSRLTEMIDHLGGVVVTTVKECTHLVTKKIIRTVKFLCAISVAQCVVTPDWILKSHESNSFLDPKDFKVQDPDSEEMFGMQLMTSIERARTRPLLQDTLVYVTQNVEPSPSSMKEIIHCAGGQVLTSVPSQPYLAELKRNSVEQESPILLVISCDKDFQLCSDFIKKGFDIHNAELILSGVLRQQLDVDLYKL